MNKICVVIPYFGSWPGWMPFFMESCRLNSSVDWLFFTDCGDLPDKPANLSLKHMSFTDYCRLVQEKTGVPFRPKNAYKLCDIKPLLGFIHAQELDGYDFWAFGDIDLVYGDLRSWLTDSVLRKYDLVSSHDRRVSGHFCLFRNNEKLTNAFRSVKGWQLSISNPEHVFFDESAFSRLFVKRKNWPSWARKLYASIIRPMGVRTCFKECYTTPNGHIPWRDGSLDFPNLWFWENGKIKNSRNDRLEYPYFHFMYWKRGWTFPVSDVVREMSRKPAWIISEKGFSS
ncbi:MAG: DUF6625 family protein [Alcanivorax sp.]|nr:DUF6625 family protein [Alcanivorax sp.]